MVDPDADKERGKPEASRDEGEGHSSFPLSTVAVVPDRNDSPISKATTAEPVVPLIKNTESCKPCCREEQVSWDVHHGPCGWNHPDEGKKNSQRGDDNCVNLTAKWTYMVFMILVEEVCSDAEDDGCANKFAEAQDKRNDS